MSRKHEVFTYHYGWRTAPEQWNFYLNGKLINLDYNTRNNLACMCLAGKVKEAEDQLKRLLRKEEKERRIVSRCIAFFVKDSNEFYYTKELAFNPINKSEALYCYKEWKNHIIKNNNILENPVTITEGKITPYGAEKVKETTNHDIIDLDRKLFINLVRSKKELIFS